MNQKVPLDRPTRSSRPRMKAKAYTKLIRWNHLQLLKAPQSSLLIRLLGLPTQAELSKSHKKLSTMSIRCLRNMGILPAQVIFPKDCRLPQILLLVRMSATQLEILIYIILTLPLYMQGSIGLIQLRYGVRDGWLVLVPL